MNQTTCKATVLNMGIPDGRYVVATLTDGELWFWGAYSDRSRAEYVREEDPEYRVIVEVDL